MRGRDREGWDRDWERGGRNRNSEEEGERERQRKRKKERKRKGKKGKGNESKREKRKRKRQMKKGISGRLPGAPVARKPPSPVGGRRGCAALSLEPPHLAQHPLPTPGQNPQPQQHQPGTFGQERLVPHNFLRPPSGRSLSLWPNL